MKKLYTLLYFLVFLSLSIAQQASDYFPAQTGFGWKFKIVPLDSLNNLVPSWAEFRIDSFATIGNYEGKNANIVTTKTGPLQTIFSQPYTDTLSYYTEGTDGFEFFSISNIESFLQELDSSGFDPNFSFLAFFKSLQNWYPVYNFSSNINSEYTLLTKDTTISTYNIRVQLTGTRLQDETIQTVLGNLNCKKFLTQLKFFTFLGPFPLELFSTKDSLWIAPGNWIVQDIIPSQTIDLTLLGIAPFTILGREIKLTDELVSVQNEKGVPTSAFLEQNYPNPFNPTTTIMYSIPEISKVSLTLFNLLGQEIITLVNDEKPAGNYSVNLNAVNLSSGVYFYRLKAGNFVETKKMILLK